MCIYKNTRYVYKNIDPHSQAICVFALSLFVNPFLNVFIISLVFLYFLCYFLVSQSIITGFQSIWTKLLCLLWGFIKNEFNYEQLIFSTDFLLFSIL